MIRLSITPHDRRTLLVGAVTVATIVGVGKGGPALRAWETARVDAAVAMRNRLERARRDASSIQAVRDSAAARGKRVTVLRGTMLRAASPDAAAATLASLVETIAEDCEVEVLSVGLRPDSLPRAGGGSGFTRVAVQLSAEGDVAGLLDLLTGVETHRRPLVIRSLTVSQPDPAAPDSKVEVLRFDLRVETLAVIAAADKPGARR